MYRNDGMQTSIVRGITKMAKILVWSSLLYSIIPLYSFIVTKDLSVFFSGTDILNFFILNEHPWGGHLWYISAYLYVLLAAFLIDKFKCWKSLLWLIPLLLLVDLVFGKYSLVIWDREFPYLWTRNWLFVGMPCFLLGTAIKMKVDVILKNRKRIKAFALGGAFLFVITSYLERYILEVNNLNAIRDNYLSSTMLALCLLMLAITTVRNQENFLSSIGNKYSLYIYILHVFVFFIMNRAMEHFPIFPLWDYIAPLYVLIITLIVTFILGKARIVKVV